MYAYIKGILAKRTNEYIVVENNGIGYHINCPFEISVSLGAIGAEVQVYLYQSVKEDDISLHGFASDEQKEMFLLLITVSGIGPKVASNICAQIDPSAFALAILNKDTNSLTKVKGLGKKSSERIILELTDKLKKSNPQISINPVNSVSDNSSNTSSMAIIDDAISALLVLGYRAEDATNVAKSTYDGQMSIEELIRACLKRMR